MMSDLSKMMARLLLLPTFIIAFGVMLKGYADVGDGFSAGVIAALGIAIQLFVFGPVELQRLWVVHLAPRGVFVGLLIALLTAFVPAIRGQALFTHQPLPGEDVVHFGTLELITAVAFDIGVFLIVFGFGVGVLASIVRAQERMGRDSRRERNELARPAIEEGQT
jgi:multisubunit Na+/H+ antiporter MnhB subunit